MFRLGVITDEVSQNLREALSFAREFALDGVELRSVEGKGPFEWRDADAKSMGRMIKEQGFSIAAISSPLFKCNLEDENTIRRHMDAFDRLSDYAGDWRCPIIRGFDFWDCGAEIVRRAERFDEIACLCEKKQITCALEYDPSVHASTPKKLKDLLDAIHHSRIRALFDPGNGIFSQPESRPYPDDYQRLRNDLCHIHIKDAKVVEGKAEAVCVGRGLVDYPGLIRQLIADKYAGYLMLETHYRLTGVLTEEQQKRPGGAAFSAGGEPASRESMAALKAIIADAQSAKEE